MAWRDGRVRAFRNVAVYSRSDEGYTQYRGLECVVDYKSVNCGND